MDSLASCKYRGASSCWSLWGPTNPAGCPLQSCCAHTTECYKGTRPLQILKASYTTRQSKTTEQSIRLLFLTGVRGKIRLGSRSSYAALALSPYAPVDQWCSQSLCQARCCFEWLASMHRRFTAQTPRGLLLQLACFLWRCTSWFVTGSCENTWQVHNDSETRDASWSGYFLTH